MSQSNESLALFIRSVEPEQCFYALQEPTSQEWVIVDAINYENQDVMPLWSTKELAQSQITDEWSDYVVAPITLADWLEFWVEDLAPDDVMIGIDWSDAAQCSELSLDEFTQALIAVEKFVK